MAQFNPQDLLNKYKQILTGGVNKLSSFVQQNPTPVSFVQNKLQQFGQNNYNAAGNIIKVGEPIQQNLNRSFNAATPAIPYYQNRIFKPLTNAVQNFKQAAQPNQSLLNRGLQAGQGALNVVGAGMSANPINPYNIGFMGYDAFKAAKANSMNQTGMSLKNVPSNLQAALEGALGQKTVGLGEALTKDPTMQTALNLAELPLTLMITHKMGKGEVVGFDKKTINTAREAFSPEVKNLIKEFAVKVETSAGANKKNMGQLGDYMQSLAEMIWGKKASNLTNKQLKNAFDILLEQVDNRAPMGRFYPIGATTRNIREELNVTKVGNTGLKRVTPETVQQITPGSLPSAQAGAMPQPRSQAPQTQYKAQQQAKESLDTIISDARKQIGKADTTDKRTVKQALRDLYTQWVDRYNPIVKASRQAKQTLKAQGAELRPENDPEYLVRRLTGAGGIADNRYRTELKPIIEELDSLKINKLDFDAYLANKRMAGFGQAGREIYGADPVKAQQVIQAMEMKYPGISQLADKFYAYQNKGLQEMVNAGFISPDDARLMQQQNPDYSPLYRVMDEVNDFLGLPARKTMQGMQPIQKIKGSTRKIESPLESIIGNTFSQRAAIEKNRVAKSIVELQNVTDLGFKKVSEAGTDTITVWNNGKKEFWNVGREIADVAKGANEEVMNLVLKIIKAPASLLRQGATGRNPEFMIPNIVRDQLDAGITSKYGYIPFIDYLSGLKSMLTNDSIYQRWERSGAKIALGELSGKKSVSQMFDEKTAKKGLFTWLSSGLDILGKFSEEPTRVGLFKRAYQKTGNELLAMLESRDATVDFARMGSKMKTANSIIPFLNVGVQGFDKLIRSVKNNPAKVMVTMGIYGVAPQLATTIYNLTNFPREYGEIPEYEKESNFVLIQGRNSDGTVDYVAIPKGNILPVVANPIQSFLEYAFKFDGKSFQEMAINTLSDAMPVLSAGNSLKEVAIKTIGSNLPQAIKPAAESLLNKSFYKYDSKKEQSKDIVPYYLQERPAYKQAYQFTPEMYKKIGAVFNVSPLQVQNLLEGYLAGYTKIPSQIVQMATKISRGEEISPNDKTIIRRFFKQTYPSSSKAPPQQPTTPSFMERVFGKANAAETKTMTPDEEKWAIEDEKYKMKTSGKTMSEVNGKILYKKDNGDIGTIDPGFEPEKPKLTGQTELDKKIISKYKGQITAKVNDIVELQQLGKYTPEQAEKLIKDLKTKSSITAGTKKPKKITFKKVSFKMPKVSTSTVKKIKISKPKVRSYKKYSINAPKLSKSKLKKVAKL
jgi:hypothetical protein